MIIINHNYQILMNSNTLLQTTKYLPSKSVNEISSFGAGKFSKIKWGNPVDCQRPQYLWGFEVIVLSSKSIIISGLAIIIDQNSGNRQPQIPQFVISCDICI